VAELKRAQGLDPLSLVVNSVLGAILTTAGRNDEAIEQLRKTIEMDPTFDLTHWFLGQAYEDNGQLAEAIAQYEKAVQLNPDPAVLASLARAYALAGRKEETRKILDNLTTESRQRYIPAYSLALIHLSLGDKEEALRSGELRRSRGLRHWRLRQYQDDRSSSRSRSDRFENLPRTRLFGEKE
jgi:serine/threonine-protein kinase